MRNIHVLPTEKPSKLFYNVGGALLFTDYENYNGVNICITSDEEIKVGDYVINSAASYVFQHYFAEGNLYKECKKIILTTDQDLIKDGVQAIDDEFLEWFVKNPSCDEVKVNNLCYGALGAFADAGYKIIIPKEETIDEGEGEAYRQELFNYLYDNFGAIASELEMRDIEIIVLSTEALKDKQEQDKNKYSEDDISTAIAMYLENKSFSEIIKQLKNK